MTSKEYIKKITAANKEAWEQVAPIHSKHNQQELVDSYYQKDFGALDEIATEQLNAINVVAKDVAQICCNNGRELLSVKKLGAARCVGFDSAECFIKQAEELAKVTGLDVEFVCTDIYDISDKYSSSFDLVTITIGVISWMPDLTEFFSVVAKLIKPGGSLFIYEQHPILDMIEPGEVGAPLNWEFSYFNKEPYVDTGGLDYYGGEKYDAKPVTSFSYTMSEIIMAGINAGLIIEHFEEFPQHISNAWWNVENSKIGLPMSYTMVMRKNS
ncbi:MAG: SAM-dependent methyltransferase [Parasphingorhabdus sp.]|jgi:SAM-dependent methyltransferase